MLVLTTTQPDYPPMKANRPGESFEAGMAILITIALLVFIYIRFNKRAWKRKFSFRGLKFNSDNLLGAHICLGALMIQADRKEAKEKIDYMREYFKRYFPSPDVHTPSIIKEALAHPVDLNLAAQWLNKYLEHKKKLQVVYFLAGMSVVDGSMDNREINLLRKISDLLELTPKEFDSIIAMYHQKEERKKSSSRPKSVSAKKSILNTAYRVLGISEHADTVEIKKAYRTLVKKHHPDRFATDSIEQQNIAEERFLEVQKSYEMIEKYK